MRTRAVLAVFLFYLALTVVMTWPLAAAPARVVPADVGDPLLNTWILWWNAHTVPLTASWWNPPAFHPAHGVLTFSEHLLGLTWLTSPLQWAGADPLAAHNVAFLASWVLCGVAGWLLGYELTGRADAALVGSAVFAFAPFRATHLSHLQVLSAYWMPLALVALHRYLRTGAARYLAAFAASWWMQGLSNGYFLVFFGVLAAAWMLWFATRAGRWRQLAGISGASAAVVLASLPVLLEYRAVHEHYGFRRSIREIAGYSADLLSVLDASKHLAVWGWLRVFHRAEGELFPGLVVVLVIAGGLLFGPVPVRRLPWQRAARAVMGMALLVAIAACVSYGVAGRWRTSWLGIALSLRDPARPLWAVATLGIALAVTRPGLRSAIARRSELLFYLAATTLMWACALGPRPTFAGEPLGWHSPYAWLTALPGFGGLRVPARFWMLAVVCLSAAAALSYARWPLPARARRTVTALVMMGIVADGWVRTLPLVAAPGPWPSIVVRNSPVPLLQLPGSPRQPVPVAMYRAAGAGRPLMNGYSGHFPPEQGILVRALGMRDLSVLDGASTLGPLDILLDRWEDDRRRFRRELDQSRATLQAADARWSLYRLPPLSDPGRRARAALPGIRPVRVLADINGDLAAHAADGRLETVWYTDAHGLRQALTLDLGRVARAGALRLAQGREPLAYPRALRVDRSTDGVTWARAWEGRGAALAWLAAVEAPRLIEVSIPFPACDARYLRVSLNVESPTRRWVVAEASVGEAPATEPEVQECSAP